MYHIKAHKWKTQVAAFHTFSHVLDSSLNLDFHALFGDHETNYDVTIPQKWIYYKNIVKKKTHKHFEAKVDYEDPVWKGKTFRNYDQDIMMYTKYKVIIFSKSIWNHIFLPRFYLAYISFCRLSFWLVTHNLSLRIWNLCLFANHHRKTRHFIQQHIRHSYTRIHLTRWQVHCTRAREQLCSFYVPISVMPHSPQGVSWVEGSSNNFRQGVGNLNYKCTLYIAHQSAGVQAKLSFQALAKCSLNVILLWEI